ncbi:MAG: general stress protein [Candidatus Limnocylindria bacterium]
MVTDLKELTREEQVVGVFHDHQRADDAVRDLEAAGFSPDRVSIVADNVRRAREPAGSHMFAGAIVGGILGVLLTAAFVVMGGEQVTQNWVAVGLGFIGFVTAGILIGALAGRARLFAGREGERLESAVDRGAVLVTVVVAPEERRAAERALRESGAASIREEATAESP